jgi:predicted ABC-class ATPase
LFGLVFINAPIFLPQSVTKKHKGKKDFGKDNVVRLAESIKRYQNAVTEFFALFIN